MGLLGPIASERRLVAGPFNLAYFLLFLVLAGIAAAILSPAARATGNYAILDLSEAGFSNLGDCHYPLGRARINASGWIAATNSQGPYLYNGSVVQIATGQGYGSGINSAGLVTGQRWFQVKKNSGHLSAFRYTNGTTTDLTFPTTPPLAGCSVKLTTLMTVGKSSVLGHTTANPDCSASHQRLQRCSVCRLCPEPHRAGQRLLLGQVTGPDSHR